VPRLRQVFGEDIGKFELVVNQWHDEAGIRMKDLIGAIGMKKFAQVPFDPTFTYVSNQQRPFVLEKPNATSDAIVSMAVRFFRRSRPSGCVRAAASTATPRRFRRRNAARGWACESRCSGSS
jgi:hypothetical protein